MLIKKKEMHGTKFPKHVFLSGKFVDIIACEQAPGGANAARPGACSQAIDISDQPTVVIIMPTKELLADETKSFCV